MNTLPVQADMAVVNIADMYKADNCHSANSLEQKPYSEKMQHFPTIGKKNSALNYKIFYSCFPLYFSFESNFRDVFFKRSQKTSLSFC